MPNDLQDKACSPRRPSIVAPLFRLLAINLAVGISVAVLLVGGLLVLNPGHLRDLILADDRPGVALGLLLFGFIVTLGSSAMGTAVMAMGRLEAVDDNPRDSGGHGVPATVAASARQGR